MSHKTKLVSLVTTIAFLLSASLALAEMSPRQIYKTKAPGVVLIVASEEGSSSASAGTGSIIQKDGMIITNAHVIYDTKANKPFPVVHVFLKPDKVTGNMNKDLTRHYAGEVVAFDKDLDLALIKMKNPPADLTVITLGDPEELGPGDETIAIGHPEQGGLWTITTGVIGAQFEDFKGIPGKNVFQMETSLNRGNSGGPLFDVRGYQVGVNTAIARRGQGGVAITGVNFALKASVVKKWTAKHNLALAYGPEALGGGDTRVAAADTAPAKQPDPTPQPPAQAKDPDPPTAAGDAQPAKTYQAPGGHGSITVEEGSGADEGEEYIPERENPPATTVSRKSPKHKTHRFHKHYRLPPRPYTYKRLYSAVDKVRANAAKAFDDLDAEINRHR
jgi:serine protease Do